MIALPEAEKSLWREAYMKVAYPKAHGTLQVDVAIIGAGITGLTSAYLLMQSGNKVAVLEKDTIGGGTTGRTTGKVTSQRGLIYEQLEKQLSFGGAKLYGQANQAAVDHIERIILKKRIDCDWRRADN
ncbi:MAG: FAD-binding oxidoreductase [bacterium]|nr:FAD-binding oxidoreductase [bacterium]